MNKLFKVKLEFKLISIDSLWKNDDGSYGLNYTYGHRLFGNGEYKKAHSRIPISKDLGDFIKYAMEDDFGLQLSDLINIEEGE